MNCLLCILSIFLFLLTPNALQAREVKQNLLEKSSYNSASNLSLSETFWQGNSQNIWNLNTGNVGIGENNPQAKLHIKNLNTKNNSPFLITDATKNSIFQINSQGIISAGKIYSESIIPGQLIGNFSFANYVDFNSTINANNGINVNGSNIILNALNSSIEWGNGAYLSQKLTHFVFAGGGKYYFDNSIGIGLENPQANLHIRESNTNVSFNDNSNLIIEGISARIDLISREFADAKINFRNIGGHAYIMYTGPAHPQHPSQLLFHSTHGSYFDHKVGIKNNNAEADLHVNGTIRGSYQASNGQSGLSKSYSLKDASGASCQMHFINGLLIESNCLESNSNPPLR